MYPVIYLTGAPASGKSTLARNLLEEVKDLAVFAYSEELRKHVGGKLDRQLSEDDIRAMSAQVVTAADVRELDQILQEKIRSGRQQRPFLIDSHAVTKEAYGFRVTSFDTSTLQAIGPTCIISLYVPVATTLQRISSDPMGRPTVSAEEAQMHSQLQNGLAAQYGVLAGCPVYLLDATQPPAILVAQVKELAGLDAR